MFCRTAKHSEDLEIRFKVQPVERITPFSETRARMVSAELLPLYPLCPQNRETFLGSQWHTSV